MGYLSKGPKVESESDKNDDFLSRPVSIADCFGRNKLNQVIAAFLIGGMLAGGSIYFYNYRNAGYAVKYDGKLIGYVRDKEAAEKALNDAKREMTYYDPSIKIDDDIEFEKLLVSSDNIVSLDTIKDTLIEDLTVQYTSYAIEVNGEVVAYVKDEEEADKVIQGVKKYFEDIEKKNGAQKVLNVTIKDDIKAVKKVADVLKIKDAKEVIDTLSSEKGTTKKYVVKSGDTIWKIANDNGISIEDVAAMNSGINVDKLQIDQVINLSVSVPYLDVETTVQMADDEDIPYDTKYVSDGSLYKGESKVVEDGEYGIKRVLKQITKLNGKQIASSVVSAAIVKNPVVRVMARGTKNLVGIGKFLWPTGGRISSGFGYRGREYHKGVDIASPSGTPIYASDSGTVVHSGRYGGYGNLVIIDHGNGYQTYYGHCKTLLVSRGDSVKRGQKIATVGMTGEATGPHVHFEVRVNGVAKNPLNYLR